MIIDLSLPIKNKTREPESPKIIYINHKEGAKHLIKGAIKLLMKKNFIKGFIFIFFNWLSSLFKIIGINIRLPSISYRDFPNEMGLANEDIYLDTHSGTHIDAPYHFGPRVGKKKARTIDKIPLEWFWGNGVRLDLRYKKAGEFITVDDIKKALKKIKYKLKPFDIVLIMTGADKYFDREEYFYIHPGMSAEAVEYIVSQGVKIIGIDAWGFDRPAMYMLKDYLKYRDKSKIFPAHFVGRKIEYLHIEKLANLDKIPKAKGFKVACFPVKIENGSAGWSRVVAIL